MQSIASVHELPDTSDHPDGTRLKLKTKHTPVHVHFLGPASLLTALETELQMLFKKYAKSRSSLVV